MAPAQTCPVCGESAPCDHMEARDLLVDYSRVAPRLTPPSGSPKALRMGPGRAVLGLCSACGLPVTAKAQDTAAGLLCHCGRDSADPSGLCEMCLAPVARGQ